MWIISFCCAFFLTWARLLQADDCFSLPSTMEIQAIKALYYATNGAGWNWYPPSAGEGAIWNFTVPNPNPCADWQGINCEQSTVNDPCHVTSLILDNRNLQGTLPSAIGNLTYLVSLQISTNPSLYGSISTTIGNLINLQAFALYSNALTGSIPSNITQLTQLTQLVVSGNHLEGSIPQDIHLLNQLVYFSISENMMTGSIPSSITQLINLQYLYLYSNSLDGPLPNAIGNLINLGQLIIYSNHITGTIPPSFTKATQLQYIYMNDLFLHGNLPEDIGNLYNVVYLIFDDNLLNGTIPSSTTKLVQLQVLGMHSNTLHGSIPNGIGNLTNLAQLSLFRNQLSGTIPTSITKSIYLQNFDISYNNIRGSIPENIGNLQYLEIIFFMFNQLTGTIPNSVTRLIYLTNLDLSNNQLRGTIPENIGNMRKLLGIGLSTNQLTGTIPASVVQLSLLQILGALENQLHGTIPNNIGMLQSLTLINFAKNMLEGTIPNSITTLPKLNTMYFFNNRLNGTIPNEIGQLSNLNSLEAAYNQFTGTIPSSLTKLIKLIDLNLDGNQLVGSIPDGIDNLTQLISLSIVTNQLSGSLPSSLTKMLPLQYIFLYQNRIGGSIPEDIGNLRNLLDFEVYNNRLTGTIPYSVTQMPKLQDFIVNSNFLHGSIPENIGALNNTMDAICLQDNDFTGSIPLSVLDLWRISELTLDFNHFVGKIPAGIVKLRYLDTFSVSNNWLTGGIYLPPPIEYFGAEGNYFYGQLNWMKSLPHLISVVVTNNVFSGTLPPASQLSVNLTYLQVSHNHLSGSIVDVFNPTLQSKIKVVDLSANKFSGSLPDALFEYNNLTYVILTQNCFTTSIPNTICNPKHTLEALVMDGLHGATVCQRRLFPGIPDIRTLADTHRITGSIPQCLFGEMPKLQTLHLSGNGLTGSLPDSYSKLNSNISQVSLSHNELTGSIPTSFQQHGFWELDLSFNLLNGLLQKDMNVSGFERAEANFVKSNDTLTTTGLRLSNNRLSGDIPESLLNLQFIDILAGNMFGCDTKNREGTLPQYDDEFDTYMCGSDEANNSMTTYGTILLAIVIATLLWRLKGVTLGSYTSFGKVLARLWNLAVEDVGKIREEQGETSAFVVFVKYLHFLRLYIATIACAVLVVFMMTYGVLGIYFSTYSNKYLWAISVGYLSGVTPGAILLVLLIALLLLNATITNKFHPVDKQTSIENDNSRKEQTQTTNDEKRSEWQFLYILAYLLINIVVVVAVNSGYVTLIISGISPVEQTFLTIFMSSFKSVWNMLVMGSLHWKSVREVEAAWGTDSITSWLLFICLFNSIVTPVVTTAMLNTNCFYYALARSDSVAYSNAGSPITFCQVYSALVNFKDGSTTVSSKCSLLGIISISTTYQPPFTYAYNCTSTLLSIFAPVWIYMFLIGGIITPLLDMFAYLHNVTREGDAESMVMETLSFYTWLQNWIMNATGMKKDSTKRMVANLDDREQVVLLCNNMAILLTFGTLFPPLAFMGCVALFVQLTTWKVLILDLQRVCHDWIANHPTTPQVKDEEEESKEEENAEENAEHNPSLILQHTQEACQRFPHTYQQTMKTIVLYVSVVWGVFLWDIAGGEVGFIEALWTFLVMVAVGLLIRFYDIILKYGYILYDKVNQSRKLQAVNDVKSNGTLHTVGEERFISGVEVDNPILVVDSCKALSIDATIEKFNE